MRVELVDIHRRFGAVRANDGISLIVEPGTIHGLLGENGAGKSTLMKILSGFLAADRGEIRLAGVPVRLDAPAQAVARGVGMLHQDPLDFPALTVLDDFLLDAAAGGALRCARARRELADRAARCGFDLDAEAPVAGLTVGERQQLEIVRLLARGVRVLILDEPTTGISAHQKERLFAALRALAAEGRSVIFVSHKLEDVTGLCSRATVLARGRVAGEVALPAPQERLVELMFGHGLARPARAPASLGAPVLEVDRLAVTDGRLELRDFSLSVRAGEVVGLAGVEGSGQRLLLHACAGLRRPLAGGIRLAGASLAGRAYRRFLDAGVGYLPGGRLEEGLIAGMTLTEHVALADRRPGFRVDWAGARRAAAHRLQTFDIQGEPSTRVETLSGGNQQRVLLALLPQRPRLLLLEHPSRGLDVGRAEAIWARLEAHARAGASILFTSSDLDELRERSDRILVFFGGRVRVLESRAATVARLGELIGGVGFESG